MIPDKVISKNIVIENGKAVEITVIERRRVLTKEQIEKGIESGVEMLQKFADINEKLIESQNQE